MLTSTLPSVSRLAAAAKLRLSFEMCKRKSMFFLLQFISEHNLMLVKTQAVRIRRKRILAYLYGIAIYKRG
jgi:hypothetical protein